MYHKLRRNLHDSLQFQVSQIKKKKTIINDLYRIYRSEALIFKSSTLPNEIIMKACWHSVICFIDAKKKDTYFWYLFNSQIFCLCVEIVFHVDMRSPAEDYITLHKGRALPIDIKGVKIFVPFFYSPVKDINNIYQPCELSTLAHR